MCYLLRYVVTGFKDNALRQNKCCELCTEPIFIEGFLASFLAVQDITDFSVTHLVYFIQFS